MIKSFLNSVWRVTRYINWGVWKTVFFAQIWMTLAFGMRIHELSEINFLFSLVLGALCYAILVYPFIIWFHWGIYFRDFDD